MEISLSTLSMNYIYDQKYADTSIFHTLKIQGITIKSIFVRGIRQHKISHMEGGKYYFCLQLFLLHIISENKFNVE